MVTSLVPRPSAHARVWGRDYMVTYREKHLIQHILVFALHKLNMCTLQYVQVQRKVQIYYCNTSSTGHCIKV